MLLLTATNQMALHGASEYGADVYPSAFEPECNGYEYTADGKSTYLKAQGSKDGKDALIEAVFQSANMNVVDNAGAMMPFLVNATNQPSFADGKQCDFYIRLFNTTLTTGSNAAKPVSGTVRAQMDLFGNEMTWDNAIGFNLDSAFIENHLYSCQALSGFDGVGPQTVEIAWPQNGPSETEVTNSSYSAVFTFPNMLANYFISPIKKVVA